jgi:nitroimidazol reductase NimA-like FMN-containing flavoprotein (pyridoxamine 5'-phosphate oxidase superfamily)
MNPRASRPHMPGYGLLPANQGSGLLPWSWAEERFGASRNYWVATVTPGGRPHAMPVWGVWSEDAFWFSSSNGSRKTRNLRANPHCAVTSEDADNPVVLEGLAHAVTEQAALARVLAWENAKYGTDYGIETLDPAANTCFRVQPVWAFAIKQGDFTGSPTRWDF